LGGYTLVRFSFRKISWNLARSSKLIGAGLLGLVLVTLLLLWPQFAQAHQEPTQNVFAQKQNSNIPLYQTIPLTVFVKPPSGVVQGNNQDVNYTLVFTVGELSDLATVTVTNDLIGPITLTGQIRSWSSNKGKSGIPTQANNQLVTVVSGLTTSEVVTVTFTGKTTYPDFNGEEVVNTTSVDPTISASITNPIVKTKVLDLIIDLSIPSSLVWIGAGIPFKYTLLATNIGDRDPTDVKITQTLPPNVTFAEVRDKDTGTKLLPSQYTLSGVQLILDNVTILHGESQSWEVEVTVENPLPYTRKELNSSVVIVDKSDPGSHADSVNLPNTDANVVLKIAQVEKNNVTQVLPGQPLAYKITVDHITTPPSNSKRHAGDIWLKLTLPSPIAGGADVSGVCVPISTNSVSKVLKVSGLDVGNSVSCQLQVTVADIIPYNAETLTHTVVMTYYLNKYDEDSKSPPQPVGPYELPIIIKAYPKLSLTETVFPTLGRPGQPLTYTINLTNSEAQAAAGVVITKTLPSSVTLLSYSGDATHPMAGVTVVYNHPHLVWTFTEPVTKGITNQLMASVIVSTDTLFSYPITQTVVMTASFNLNDQDKMGESTSAVSHTIVITSAPNLDLQLSGPSTVDSGATAAYTLVISNYGFATAKGVVVKIKQNPAYMTLNSAIRNGSLIPFLGANGNWTLNLGDFAPTDPLQNIVLNFTANAVTSADVPVDTSMVVTENEGYDPITSNNFASKATVIKVASDIHLTFSGSPLSTGPGGILGYTLEVNNTGSGPAYTVVVRIPIPTYSTLLTGTAQTYPSGYSSKGTYVEWVIPSLNINDPKTYHLEVKLDSVLSQKQFVLTSTATVNVTSTTPITLTSDPVIVQVTVPTQLEVSHGYTPLWAEPGGLITYTIWITNNGNINADAGSAVVTITTSDYMTYKAGGTCSSAIAARSKELQPIPISLLAKTGVSCTITLKVDTTNLPASLWDIGLESVVSVTAKFAGAVDVKDSKKSVPITAPLKIDLTIVPNKDTVLDKEPVTYTVKLKNNGQIGLKDVVLTVALPHQYVQHGYTMPPTWAIGELAVGQEITKEVYLTARSALSVSFMTTATVTANNGYSQTMPAKVTIGDFPDLGVQVTRIVAAPDAAGGITVTYAITVKNDSRVSSLGGSLTIGIPQYTTMVTTPQCASQTSPSIPDLGAGAEKPYCFMVKVNNPLASGVDEIVSTVEIQAKDSVLTPSNDRVEVKVRLDEARPNLAITITMTKKDGTNEPVKVGDRLIYTLWFSNPGNQLTVPPAIAFQVSPGLATVDSSLNCPTGTFRSANTYTATFKMTDVLSGINEQCSINVEVVKKLPGLGKAMLQATATITDGNVNGPDANIGNNSATLIDEIVPREGIELGISSYPPEGIHITKNIITHTLTLTNEGESPAERMLVRIWPTNFKSFNSVSGCVIKEVSTGLFEWVIDQKPFPAQGVAQCQLVGVPLNRIKNVSVKATTDCDSGCAPETDQMTNHIYQTPIVTMAPSAKTTFLGDVLTYTISLTNSGGLDLPVTATFNYSPANTVAPRSLRTTSWPIDFMTASPSVTNFVVPKNGNVTYQNVITVPDEGAQTVEVELLWEDAISGLQKLPKQIIIVYPVVQVDITDNRNFVVPKAVIPYTVTVVSDQLINNMSLTVTLPVSITAVEAPGWVVNGLKSVTWNNLNLSKNVTQTLIFTTIVISRTHRDYVEMNSEVQAYAAGMEKAITATDSTLILSPISVIVIGPVSVALGDAAKFFYIISNIGDEELTIDDIYSSLTGRDYRYAVGTKEDLASFVTDNIIVLTATYDIEVPDTIVGPPMLSNIVTVSGTQKTADKFFVMGVGGNTPEFLKVVPPPGTDPTFSPVLTTSITYKGDFELAVIGEPGDESYTVTIRNLPKPRADGSPVISLTIDYGDGEDEPWVNGNDTQLSKNEVWTRVVTASRFPSLISTITVAGLNGNYEPVSHTYTLNRYYKNDLPILTHDFSPHPIRVSIAKISQDKHAVSETATIMFRLDTVELNGARIESYDPTDESADEKPTCDSNARTCTVKYTIRSTDSNPLTHTLFVNVTYRTVSATLGILSVPLDYTMTVTYHPQLKYQIVNIPGRDISMLEQNGNVWYDVLVSHDVPNSDCSPIKEVKVTDVISSQLLSLETTGDRNGTLDCGDTWRYRSSPYRVPTGQNPFVVKVNVTGYDMNDNPFSPATADTYPVQICQTLGRDTFDNPSTGWLQSTRFPEADYKYQDGWYILYTKQYAAIQSISPFGYFSNYNAAVMAQWNSGLPLGRSLGLIFGIQGNVDQRVRAASSFYQFSIDTKNSPQFRLQRWNESKAVWEVVVDWQSSPKINKDIGLNKLAVQCNGTNATLYINDAQVWQSTLPYSCQGGVGVTSVADATTINSMAQFDNFNVCGTKTNELQGRNGHDLRPIITK